LTDDWSWSCWGFLAALSPTRKRRYRIAILILMAVDVVNFGQALTELLGGVSGQHYYPQGHTLGIWAAFFLSLRVHIEGKGVARGVADPDSSTVPRGRGR
jgi:hypothetical protein